MKEIDLGKPILVTGGSGYIASWIIKLLIEEGRHVKTTVRDKSDENKVGHLLKMGEEYSGTLDLFDANLLDNGSFEEAMTDCELVLHTASPFQMFKIKDPQNELIKPALEGTKNVLLSANKIGTVKRVVLTSSTVAIIGDAIDIKSTPNNIFTEDVWNTTSSPDHLPYSYSKTIAEREAWKIANEQKQWDLVTINPGLVLGPSITNRVDSFSIDMMLSFMNGKYKSGVPDLHLFVVDVRDVAKAHISAGSDANASGRHILVSDTLTFLEVANILRKKYGDYQLPKSNVPKLLLYLFGPLQGFSWKFLKLNHGIPVQFDNKYSKEDLGMEYIPIEKTLNDHANQIIESGLLR